MTFINTLCRTVVDETDCPQCGRPKGSPCYTQMDYRRPMPHYRRFVAHEKDGHTAKFIKQTVKAEKFVRKLDKAVKLLDKKR